MQSSDASESTFYEPKKIEKFKVKRQPMRKYLTDHFSLAILSKANSLPPLP